jgi:predicted nucleic acid-binding protein
MILVDSSVWVDYFNDNKNDKTALLYHYLDNEIICITDIILIEVLQGIKNNNHYITTKRLLEKLIYFEMLNKDIVMKTIENYRFLRKKGITIRKTIDCIIATFCIENNITLLHNDKDFIPFETNFDLQTI